jgi:hypothetical protein
MNAIMNVLARRVGSVDVEHRSARPTPDRRGADGAACGRCRCIL